MHSPRQLQASGPILALECATGPVSVALWHEGRILAHFEHAGSAQQSAVLMPAIVTLMQDAGISFRDLSAVACSTGPGSFTGIRSGLAAARGIGFAAHTPVLCTTTLHVLSAMSEQAQHPVLAVLSAGKGECYGQYYHHHAAITEVMVAPLEHVLAAAPGADVAVVGNVRVSQPGFLQTQPSSPSAAALARLAATGACTLPASPFYVRPPDAIPKSART